MQKRFLRHGLKFAQILLLVGVLVGLFYLLKKDFQAETLQELLQQAQWTWLAAAVACAFAGLACKAWRLQVLARDFGLNHPLWACFRIQVLSISLGMLTPGRAGELSKVFLLAQKQKQGKSNALWVMIIERLGDMGVLGLLALGYLLYAFPEHRLRLLWLAGLTALAGLVLCFFWQKSPLRQHPWLSALQHLRWKSLWPLGLLSFGAWCLDGLFQLCILASIQLSLPLFLGIGINAVVAIAGIFSLLPIGLGTVDLSALVLYQHSANLDTTAIVFLLGAGRVLGLGLLGVLFGGIALTHPQLLTGMSAGAVKPAQMDDARETET